MICCPLGSSPSPPLFHRRLSETVQEEQVHFFSQCQCCRSSKHWLFTPAVFAAAAKRHIVQRSLLLFYRLSGHWGSSIQPLAHASQLEHSTCLGSSSCLCPNIIIPCFKTTDLIISNSERQLGHWCHIKGSATVKIYSKFTSINILLCHKLLIFAWAYVSQRCHWVLLVYSCLAAGFLNISRVFSLHIHSGSHGMQVSFKRWGQGWRCDNNWRHSALSVCCSADHDWPY